MSYNTISNSKLFETNKFDMVCVCMCVCMRHKDYLGAVILFAAIVTALFAARIYSNATSPSLVALAINYTLLVPIYLNWVVKLSSDLESYIGAVERISHYIGNTSANEQQPDKTCKSKQSARFLLCTSFIQETNKTICGNSIFAGKWILPSRPTWNFQLFMKYRHIPSSTTAAAAAVSMTSSRHPGDYFSYFIIYIDRICACVSVGVSESSNELEVGCVKTYSPHTHKVDKAERLIQCASVCVRARLLVSNLYR